MLYRVLKIALLLVIAFPVEGQVITRLENRIAAQTKKLERAEAVLDSLGRLLEERARLIDAAKKKPAYDENRVKKLMAASVTLSNTIEEQRVKISSLENEIERLKKDLRAEYNSVIDSLTALENSPDYKGDKNALRNEILLLTSKRILTEPKIYSLSFSPEKIIALNTAGVATAEEKKIFYDYLNGALLEVDSKLSQVKSTATELKQMLSLQKKTRKFVEQVEFGSGVGRTSISLRSSGEKAGTSTTGELTSSDLQAGVRQVQTYFYILKQLEFRKGAAPLHRGEETIDPTKKKISLQDYYELLIEVEKRLSDYRALLTSKIGSAK